MLMAAMGRHATLYKILIHCSHTTVTKPFSTTLRAKFGPKLVIMTTQFLSPPLQP